MILLIYQIRRVVDYEMKLFIKNRICPMIFKRPPNMNEIHLFITALSLLLMLMMFVTVRTVITEFRADNVEKYYHDTYNSCRITHFTTEIIDGKHIMSYMCETIVDVDGERAETYHIDERQINGNYNYRNQRIRILREPNILTNGLPYDIYHRQFKQSPTTQETP